MLAAIVLRATAAILLTAGGGRLQAQNFAANSNGIPKFRFAVSARFFTDVNENDAKAAIKVWAQTAMEQNAVPVEAEAVFVENFNSLVREFQDSKVDAAALTIDEYLTLSRKVKTSDLFADELEAGGGDSYLLLVHQDGPIKSLADLKGRKLLLHDNPTSCLAVKWLDIVLARHGMPPADTTFAELALKKKLSGVVLPVFFRTEDVCVVPKHGFDTMVELNPQLGTQLHALATSPRLVTGICCYRASYDPPQRSRIIESFIHLDDSPSGQQILTVFQTAKLARVPDSALESAKELLAEHERLFGAKETGHAAAPPGRPTQAGL